MSKKETMIKWAIKAHRQRCHTKTPLLAVNADLNAASRQHLARIKPGKPLYPGLYLKSWERISCPLITSVSTLHSGSGRPARKPWAEVGVTTGAYLFRFESQGKRFPVIYACWEHGYLRAAS